MLDAKTFGPSSNYQSTEEYAIKHGKSSINTFMNEMKAKYPM